MRGRSCSRADFPESVVRPTHRSPGLAQKTPHGLVSEPYGLHSPRDGGRVARQLRYPDAVYESAALPPRLGLRVASGTCLGIPGGCLGTKEVSWDREVSWDQEGIRCLGTALGTALGLVGKSLGEASAGLGLGFAHCGLLVGLKVAIWHPCQAAAIVVRLTAKIVREWQRRIAHFP